MNRKMQVPLWALVLIIGAVCIGIGFYLGRGTHETPSAFAPPTPPLEPSATPSGPVAQYPVPPSAPDTSASANSPESQPAPATLDASDEPLDRWLGNVIGQDRIDTLFGRTDLLRRFVKTVQSSAEAKIPDSISLFKPLEGDFRVDQTPDGAVLSAANYARYSSYVELIANADEKKLAKIYVRYYGLIQTAFKEVGMDGYFNDLLVSSLDKAIAAPDVEGPVKLVQDGYYKFVDPQLEGLSASQKALIRMGPANAARVKAKLKAFRQRLTRLNLE